MFVESFKISLGRLLPIKHAAFSPCRNLIIHSDSRMFLFTQRGLVEPWLDFEINQAILLHCIVHTVRQERGHGGRGAPPGKIVSRITVRPTRKDFEKAMFTPTVYGNPIYVSTDTPLPGAREVERVSKAVPITVIHDLVRACTPSYRAYAPCLHSTSRRIGHGHAYRVVTVRRRAP
jgi:hypothetical protein